MVYTQSALSSTTALHTPSSSYAEAAARALKPAPQSIVHSISAMIAKIESLHPEKLLLQLPTAFAPDQIHPDGRTPIQTAISTRSYPIIDAVLARTPLCHLLIPNQRARFPFEQIIEINCPAIHRLFLQKVTSLDQLIDPTRQMQVLLSIMQRHKLQLFTDCLAKAPKPEEIADKWGRTFLFYAMSSHRSFKEIVLSKKISSYFTGALSHYSFQYLTCILTPRLQSAYIPDSQYLTNFNGAHSRDMYLPLREYFWRFAQRQTDNSQLSLHLPHWYTKAIADALLLPPRHARPSEYVRRITAGSPTIICTGWLGHAMNIVFANSYVFFINRGEVAKRQRRLVEVFRYNLSSITYENIRLTLDAIMCPKNESEVMLYETFISAIEGRKDRFCRFIERQYKMLKPQDTHPNCVTSNAKGGILCFMLAYNARMHLKTYSSTIYPKTVAYYRDFVNFTRSEITRAWQGHNLQNQSTTEPNTSIIRI